MRRYKMEIEKGIPKVGGSLPLTSGQDAGMQPTLLKVDRKSAGWQWLLLLLCSSLLASCLSTVPDIDKLRMFAEDRRQAPFPPTEEELTSEQPFVLVLPPSTQPGVTTYANDNSLSFIKSMMEDAGNLLVFPEQRLQQVRDSSQYRMLDIEREEDAIKLAEAVRAKYLVMMSTAPPSFDHDTNDWSAVVTMHLYQLSPVQKLAQETFPYQQSKLEDMRLDLRPKLQAALPLKAFLVETYERRKVARLNVGMDQGAEELDRFAVYRRDKRSEKSGRITTHTEEYGKQVGTLEIFRSKQNESWALLEATSGEEILPGDAAFKVVRYRTDYFRKIDLGRFD
jgi:hypothetical protein